jgi:hypothetical protein
MQYLRGQLVTDDDFLRRGDTVKALVELELDDTVRLVNLDDPSQLVKRRIRPSQVATLRRAVTQGLAASLFEEGAGGLLWWSTLEAEWTNVTLFHERAVGKVTLVGSPRKLSLGMSEVQNAAAHLGIVT